MGTKKNMNAQWLGEDSFFKNHFPFNEFKEQLNLDPSEVDKYVENAISKAMAGHRLFDTEAPAGKAMRHELLDTHHFILVKISVPREMHPENLWVQASRTQLKYSRQEGKTPQIITLPAPVNPAKSSATFKTGSLEVKLPKLRSGAFQEVPIRYL
ncbi:Hsp20/alpha crystallin family protein [Paenibacillus sp. SN-8-1]|uniref:Hsp20/alpha crystallin family protein n=1 Tax=Paenibacillus sp. SN-8-1 TaxID=3435409 RepID=UPI003D9A745B